MSDPIQNQNQNQSTQTQKTEAAELTEKDLAQINGGLVTAANQGTEEVLGHKPTPGVKDAKDGNRYYDGMGYQER